MKYVQSKDRKIQDEMNEAQIPLVHTGKVPIGWMEKETWRGMHDLLLEQGFLRLPVADISSVFTLDILDKIYNPVHK